MIVVYSLYTKVPSDLREVLIMILYYHYYYYYLDLFVAITIRHNIHVMYMLTLCYSKKQNILDFLTEENKV